jgi:hypothetical protein
MASEFDRLMQQADDALFRVFGEDESVIQPTYTSPGGIGQSVDVSVMLGRNVEVAGADGSFRTIQLLAELRLSQIAKPRRGGRLKLAEGDFLLEEPIDSDGLVERWTLMPLR